MVYILLAEGFEEAEALVPADLLRRAGVETALVSLAGKTVAGSHGITVETDLTLSQVDEEKAELVMLPGGSVGVDNLGKDPRVEALVRRQYERGGYVAAICAAPTLLGRWGLLQGKKAVCYPGLEDKLTGARSPEGARVVQDGTIITGQAAGSAFPFGLKLAETLAGAEKAERVRQGVYYGE